MNPQNISTKTFQYNAMKNDLMALASEYHGNLKIIADKVNIDYRTITTFYHEQEEFKQAVDAARDAFYDLASNKLAELINSKNMAALNLFFSKSPQAKAHGWGERLEQEQNIHLNDTQKAEEAKRLLGLN